MTETKSPLYNETVFSAFVVAKEVIYCLRHNGNIAAVSVKDGKLIAEHEARLDEFSQVELIDVVDGYLYFTDEHNVYRMLLGKPDVEVVLGGSECKFSRPDSLIVNAIRTKDGDFYIHCVTGHIDDAPNYQFELFRYKRLNP